MRVAIDARYIREKPSGIGTYVDALVTRLPPLAPTDHFEFWTHPLAARPLSSSPNTREVVVRSGPNSPLPVWWPTRYASFADINLFHSPHNMMPRGLPCPAVVTVHDVMAIERPELHLQGLERIVKRSYYPGAVWRALRHATRIVTPTQDVADRVGRLEPGAQSRVRVIPEAADPVFQPAHDFDATSRRVASMLGSETPYLLVVGANSATKRHQDVVTALTMVPRPWRLVLLQRQGASGRLATLARQLGVLDRITWVPRVTRDQVIALMQCAGALVQPSVYEGFGLPIIEAMACGCPVVASDIPVFREVTAHAAVFAKPGEPVSLGHAIRTLVSSAALRADLSAAGLVRARSLSWDRAASETLQVYREAMVASRPHERSA